MGAGRPNRDAANPHDKPVIPRRRKATRLGCWKRSRPERYVTAFLPAAVYFHAGLVLPVLAGMARWVRQGPATAAAAIGAAVGMPVAPPAIQRAARMGLGLADGGHRTRRAAP